jgi:hypothetical protein
MTYASLAWEFAADIRLLKLQRLKQGSPHHWQFSKAHTGPRIA